MTLQDPIWSNPYQRFGFIIVNVLIGAPLESDRELFFGPVHPNDVWYPPLAPLDGDEININLAQLLVRLGIFESVKEAERNGFRRPIPEGFSDWMKITRRKHRVTILKVTK